jgi:rSAM/selenodomain-associated transferase 1
LNVQLLVFAKQPVPGRVKTRLCPPCTHRQAAAVAAAALEDTIAAVQATPSTRRTLVVSGSHAPPPGWTVARQHGAGLGERIARAFADTAVGGVPSLLIGMDTPQVTPDLLTEVVCALRHADAVLGPAEDGGWWTLALRDAQHAGVLRDVAMSTNDTGALTAAALRRRALTVQMAPTLCDVDTAADAWAVARTCPVGRFAAAVRANVPLTDGSLA